MNVQFIRKLLEEIIIVGRWIYVPIYIGMIVLIFLFAAVVIRDIYVLFLSISSINENELIIEALELCDALLIANLLYIVVISGYSNFICNISLTSNERKIPKWLTETSQWDVKMKIASSLVAISSIKLLKQFLNIDNSTSEKLAWYVGIHLTFVLSALLCSYITSKPGKR